MDKFKQHLSDVIKQCIALSSEWENLSDEDTAKVNEKYPFHKDFQELIADMQEWKESL